MILEEVKKRLKCLFYFYLRDDLRRAIGILITCLVFLGADSNSCALVVFATVRVGFIDLALSTASGELLSVLVRAEAADLQVYQLT